MSRFWKHLTAEVAEDAAAPAVEQCTNDDDLAIIGSGEIDVTAVAQSCGLGCLDDDEPDACSVACIVDATGMSSGCATCYGGSVACSVELWLVPCASDPSSDECGTCQAAHCAETFYACSGLSPTADPDAGADGGW